jgi:hypothetical protein
LNLNEDKRTFESLLISVSKCWPNITQYLLNQILTENNSNQNFAKKRISSEIFLQSYSNQVFQNALHFYSSYLSKLTQLKESSKDMTLLIENISQLFDTHISESHQEQTVGSRLCQLLIKEFDKCFLIDTNQTLKLSVSNMMKCLLSLSDSAKKTALNGMNF